MKTHILFIHGAGKGAFEEDALLAESLQRELGTNYLVRYPQMINEDSPEYFDWEPQITGEIASLSGNLILVGHSVGGSVLLKYVMENRDRLSVAGLFMIATPFWGADEFWKWDEVLLPDDVEGKLNGLPVFIYHNRHDEVVPFNHLQLYAAKLPNAFIREVQHRGHQLDNNLSAVATDIKQLVTT
jgi:predicted alpha/beta hydrolase family esterase